MNQTVKTPLSGTLAEAEISPRRVREAAGLSQEAMAELMGMGDYGYGAWERGARQPGGPARKLLALIASEPDKMIALLKSQTKVA